MSSDFVKIYPGFFRGSLTDTPPYARLLFLAMLSQADHRGVALGTVGFWSAYAGLTKDQVAEGLEILSSPDPESTSPDEEGRRIVPFGDGRNQWRVVNYRHYYEKGRAEERKEYKREWDRTHRNPTRSDKSDKSDPESESESETKPSKRRDVVEELLAGLPPVFAADAAFVRALRDYEAFRVEQKHKPWAPATVKKKHAEWSKRNPSEVAEALEKSVAQGYQGVFLNPKPQKKEFTFRDVE